MYQTFQKTGVSYIFFHLLYLTFQKQDACHIAALADFRTSASGQRSWTQKWSTIAPPQASETLGFFLSMELSRWARGNSSDRSFFLKNRRYQRSTINRSTSRRQELIAFLRISQLRKNLFDAVDLMIFSNTPNSWYACFHLVEIFTRQRVKFLPYVWPSGVISVDHLHSSNVDSSKTHAKRHIGQVAEDGSVAVLLVGFYWCYAATWMFNAGLVSWG